MNMPTACFTATAHKQLVTAALVCTCACEILTLQHSPHHSFYAYSKQPGTVRSVEVKSFDGVNWEQSYSATGIKACSSGGGGTAAAAAAAAEGAG